MSRRVVCLREQVVDNFGGEETFENIEFFRCGQHHRDPLSAGAASLSDPRRGMPWWLPRGPGLGTVVASRGLRRTKFSGEHQAEREDSVSSRRSRHAEYKRMIGLSAAEEAANLHV